MYGCSVRRANNIPKTAKSLYYDTARERAAYRKNYVKALRTRDKLLRNSVKVPKWYMVWSERKKFLYWDIKF